MGLFSKKKSEAQPTQVMEQPNYNNYQSNNYQNSIQSTTQQSQSGGRWAQAAQAAETQNRGEYQNGGYYYGQSIEQEPDEEEEKSEWLSNRTRQVQQDSVESSRRALHKLRQAEESGSKSLNLMATQSEQLANAERRLGSAEHHIKSSNAKTDEIKAYNRFFMIPTFGAEKKGRKKQDKLNREREEQCMAEDERYAQTSTSIQQMREQSNRSYGGSEYQQRNHHTGYYTTPDGLERDDLENEIDGNLNEISSGLARMKMMSLAMQTGLKEQSDQISRIGDRSDRANESVIRVNGKMERIIRRN
ncbi:Protein transport protein S9 plasma membrane t-SNARE [Clydaea vesicula]|uniref:Protein transport protein S9 plasma membrane t-SNARE n=1 Tax=Clydaea vesicula TaxID=447962 RepID=A0AAD5U613_9FUNG|nr:Protein transport protein S9 plasma membrane t-SNARE [Clydaea vesicula]KAJ3385358.1 Protein transport protein S9 plasma membrane t-SNARE [Lobulomyces angularis]